MGERIDLKSWLRKASRLSLIRIDVESEEKLVKDLIKIIEFFNQLREVNVENVEPLFMNPIGGYVVRDDEPKECLKAEEVLINVKEKVDGYVKGPRTL
ncbi:MAG: Asp-tRNA(Asn)/Glu-tRNA(Gln) amidotransferase GatCAB subunit C [Thermoprotei archaeon]|nr:MAG: Asp-tRNA(Asn)/Glu-tRNA(Gln) amidotransferase GatCAB subunit C [Thermoprotei archaeon]